MHTYVYIYAIE